MAGDGRGKKARKKKKMSRRKLSADQSLAAKYIYEWTSLPECGEGEFLPKARACWDEKVPFELHCHSNRSDGYLSPKALVERAHRNGVRSPLPWILNSIDLLH